MSEWKVITGDCLDVLRTLPDGSVDAVVTDPVFCSGTRREASKGLRKSMTRGTDDDEWITSDQLTASGFVWLMRACAQQWKRLLVPGGHALSFIDWRMCPWLAGAMESADLRHAGLLAWDKTYFGMGSCFRNQHELILHFTKGKGRDPLRRDVGNVLSFKPVRGGDHPTEKPVDLLTTLISVVCPEGGTVLDCFAGSGSTGEAAVTTGRNFIGCDSDPHWAEYARRRIAEAVPLSAEVPA
jgi:DNA modification methylase